MLMQKLVVIIILSCLDAAFAEPAGKENDHNRRDNPKDSPEYGNVLLRPTMGMMQVNGEAPDNHSGDATEEEIGDSLASLPEKINESANHHGITLYTKSIIIWGKMPSKTDMVQAIKMGISMESGASLIP